jgi:hypothetical protein
MKIMFRAESKIDFEVCPRPVPTSQYLPEWWRKATPYEPSKNDPEGKKMKIRGRETTAMMKKCTPMLDLLTAGYIVPLWSDVLVEQDENNLNISWRVQKNVFDTHNPSDIAIPDGYKHQAKYMNYWLTKLPKGYSMLVIPPIGYPNNPFRVMPAIVDYDTYPISLTPPCFVKEGFNGVVERGTPMMQLIPFKRDNWESEYSYMEPDELVVAWNRDLKNTLVNNYIKNFWQKKSFK